MEVKIRDKIYNIPINTDEFIRSFIAYYTHSIPEYIIHRQTGNTITYNNAMDLDTNTILSDFIKRTEPFGLSEKQSFELWIRNQKKVIRDLGKEDFKKYLIDVNIPELTDREIDHLIRETTLIKQRIKMFREQQSEWIENASRFGKIKGLKYTPFVKTYEEYTTTLDIDADNLSEIFDIIKLNNAIPFATYNNLYKILNDFPLPEEWIFSLDEAILLKIEFRRTSSKTIRNEHYQTITIYRENNKFKINIPIEIQPNYLQNKDYKNYIHSLFSHQTTVNLSLTNPDKIKGEINFPELSFNRYVYADLCMNDRLFSSLLYVNEINKSYKVKDTILVHTIGGDARASITQQIADYVSVDNTIEYGTEYVSTKITGKNIRSIYNLIDIISKLWILYSQQYEDIVSFYRKYLPKFAKYEKKVVVKPQRSRLRDIVPDLFIANYSRTCAKTPTVIDNITDAKPEQQVMKFPRYGPNNHLYICDYKSHPYPGIKDNILENREKYPYLPCCYQQDQREKSLYKKYFLGEDEGSIQTNRRIIVSTKRLLNEDIFGAIPDEVNQLLTSFDPEISYYRKGVSRSRSSFIECVAESVGEFIDEPFKYPKGGGPRLNKMLKQKREECAERAELAKQQNYDISISQIRDNIRDTTKYLDPNLYINILEDIYKCNIFIFRDSLVIPRHRQGYLKFKNKYTRNVLIYENNGVDLEYPQCELIISQNPKFNISEFYFQSKKINNTFNRMNLKYRLKTLVKNTIIPKFNIVSQGYDNYGKTRVISISHKDKHFNLFTDPLPNLNVPSKSINDFLERSSIKSTIKVMQKYDIDIIEQTIVDSQCTEIMGVNNNIRYRIPTKPGEPMGDIKRTEQTYIVNNVDVSRLTTFRKHKKIARIMVEYMLYLFSTYIRMNNMDINEFFKKCIVVKSGHTYTDIDSRFFSKTSSFVDNNCLVVDSDETVSRLKYVLRLNIIQRYSKILEYHTKTRIDNFYENIQDYQTYQDQILLESKDSVLSWLNNKNSRKYVYTDIITDYNLPYFFKNKIVSDSKISLVQNTKSIGRAVNRDKVWREQGYNTQIPENNDTGKLLYSYRNSKDIIGYNMGNLQNKVIGYLDNGEANFTSVMGL